MATYQWGKDFLSVKCNGQNVHNLRFVEGANNTYDKYIGSHGTDYMSDTLGYKNYSLTSQNIGFTNKISTRPLYDLWDYRFHDYGTNIVNVANSTDYYSGGVDDRGIDLQDSYHYKVYIMPCRYMRTGTNTKLWTSDDESKVSTPKDVNAFTRTTMNNKYLNTEYSTGTYSTSGTSTGSGNNYYYGNFSSWADTWAWKQYANVTEMGTYAHKSMFAWIWKPVSASSSSYDHDLMSSTSTSGFDARVRIIGAWSADFSPYDTTGAYSSWRDATDSEWQAVVGGWGNFGQWYNLNYQRNEAHYTSSGLSYTEKGGCFYKAFNYSHAFFRTYHLRVLFEVEIGGTRKLSHQVFMAYPMKHWNSIGMVYNLWRPSGTGAVSTGRGNVLNTTNANPYCIALDCHKISCTSRYDAEQKWKIFFEKGGQLRLGTATQAVNQTDVKFIDGTNVMTSYNPSNFLWTNNKDGDVGQYYNSYLLAKLDSASTNVLSNNNGSLNWEAYLPANSGLHTASNEQYVGRYLF